ncbi:MAG: hypothetical protein ACE5F1_06130 [Planctomycetota bacterium]
MKITEVLTDGFKGDCERYALTGRDIVKGPHGAGKTRLREAIQFALSGHIPGVGRRNDDLAQFVEAKGGGVRVRLEDRQQLERRIERDPERAKVSTSLETTHGPADFEASDVVLDLGELVGQSAAIKSPERKRGFVLRLLGSSGGEADAAKLLVDIADAYAKELNSMAGHQHLGPKRIPELPIDVQPHAVAWCETLGIEEILKSHLVAGLSLSELCLRLSEAARQERRKARAGREEAHKALSALEEGLDPADAPDLEAQKKAHSDAIDALTEASAKVERWEAARDRLCAADQDHVRAQQELLKVEEAIAALPELARRPETQSVGNDVEGFERALDGLNDEIVELQGRSRLKKELDRLQGEMACLKRAPMEALVENWNLIRTSEGVALETVPEYVGSFELALEAVSEIHERRKSLLGLQLCNCEDELSSAGGPPSPGALDRAKEAYAKKSQSLREARDLRDSRLRHHAAELAEWERLEERRRALGSNLEIFRGQVDQRSRDHQQAEAALEELGARPALDDLDQHVNVTSQRLQEAQEATGKLQASEAARTRVTSLGVSCEAWGYCLKAIAKVREALVLDAAAPLVLDANQVLARSGRDERIYLELENERGKPTWEFGWIAGGKKRGLDALSGAETLLVTTALSVAIALHSEGRKILLIEAAEIHADVPALLEALSGVPEEIENVVVLTALDEVEAPEGWSVIELELKNQSGARERPHPAPCK